METSFWVSLAAITISCGSLAFEILQSRRLRRENRELKQRELTFQKRNEKTFAEPGFIVPAESRTRISTAHFSQPRKNKNFKQS